MQAFESTVVIILIRCYENVAPESGPEFNEFVSATLIERKKEHNICQVLFWQVRSQNDINQQKDSL